MDIREQFFYERAVKHWNRLPSKVAELPSLEVFKRHVGVVFIDMVSCFSGGLGSAKFKVGLDDLMPLPT